MLHYNTQTPDSFYEYIGQFINKYVEIYTYFSYSSLYGEIIEVTPLYITLSLKYIDINSSYVDVNTSDYDRSSTLYLPLTSVISIREL